jgi:hypothetical protein
MSVAEQRRGEESVIPSSAAVTPAARKTLAHDGTKQGAGRKAVAAKNRAQKNNYVLGSYA